VAGRRQFVVNGQKIWTSNALHADRMFALVRTHPASASTRACRCC
jgi:alkylation response protein AidB-like acyl-CoA dehydrogenase